MIYRVTVKRLNILSYPRPRVEIVKRTDFKTRWIARLMYHMWGCPALAPSGPIWAEWEVFDDVGIPAAVKGE